MRKLVWFSCGAASAVTAKLAVEKYQDCELLYCDTLAYEHPDNLRFLNEVEGWTGKKVIMLKSEKYKDIYDVFEKTGWLVGVGGARCTTELKKKVRKAYQRDDDLHLFGLTFDEEKRILGFDDRNDIETEWLLYDAKITKDDCYRMIQEAGIALPAMYLLGYNNNNCIGCVKGGQGYWNKIRVDFPEHFLKMAKLERKLNVAINKTYVKGVRTRTFLDKLKPGAGFDVPMPNIDCGVVCVNDSNNRVIATEDFKFKFDV